MSKNVYAGKSMRDPATFAGCIGPVGGTHFTPTQAVEYVFDIQAPTFVVDCEDAPGYALVMELDTSGRIVDYCDA